MGLEVMPSGSSDIRYVLRGTFTVTALCERNRFARKRLGNHEMLEISPLPFLEVSNFVIKMVTKLSWASFQCGSLINVMLLHEG